MSTKKLMETALRVLSEKVNGGRPSAADVRKIKQHALPEEAGLDTDRIACQVVAREIQKMRRKPHK